jgi:hypothetical protein
MLQGLVCGISTLGWAMVVFVLFIYLVALMCRETLGPTKEKPSAPNEHLSPEETEFYFETVPHSMFTVFRCSFGDCTSKGGTSLFEPIAMERPWWGVLYALFTFAIVIGLFNVISAIFVESTLSYANGQASEKLQQRLDSPKLWAVNVTQVLTRLLMKKHPDVLGVSNLEKGDISGVVIDTLVTEEFDKKMVEHAARNDEHVRHALAALDINSEEYAGLSNTLDPDNTGTISSIELVEGLKRLRGNPRRGDIIAVDMMIRSMQEKVDFIWKRMRHLEVVDNVHDNATDDCKLMAV